MCGINDYIRPPVPLYSDALDSHNTYKQPSNDFFGFPTTLILGKWWLGWRTWILLILKRHLFYCKLKNWHHSDMHTHLWWAGFVIKSGKWTSKILDIWDEDQTRSPCCPCQWQKCWGVLSGQSACHPLSLTSSVASVPFTIAWSSLHLERELL